MGRAFASVTVEVVEDLGVDPSDLAAAQSAFLFDPKGWRLVGMERDDKWIYPRIYRLTIEADELPDGETILIGYMRNNITGATWLDKWWIPGTEDWRKAGSDANG